MVSEEKKSSLPNDLPIQVLKEIFGYQEFRPNQKAVIDNILNGINTLAIMPTGAGKSLCFQIPAIIFPGTTIVISPLIALMKDQVDALRRKGIQNSAFLNSSLNEQEHEELYNKIKQKQIKLLYLAPETLLNNKLISILKENTISLIAIDEAHCISTWGHDFRPDYLKIREVIKELKDPTILALTATANKKVEEDIINQLSFSLGIVKDTFDRKNLLLSILKLKPGQQKNIIVKEILEKITGPAIIYVNFVKTSEELSSYLKEKGFNCNYYNGTLDHSWRKEIQESFLQGKTRIIVATNAFGMGIDKPDIRTIIHYDVPKSMESYYQETGRAGRDNKESHCILLYSQEDSIKLKKLIRLNLPDTEKIDKLIKFLEKDAGKTVYINYRALASSLEIDEVTFRLLLHYLEKMNLINMHNRIFRKVLIKGLEEEKLKSENPETSRIFSTHYFEKNKKNWLDLEELSILSETPLNKINAVLQDLKSKNLVQFIEGETSMPLEIKKEIRQASIKDIEALFKKLATNNANKLRDVIDYINYPGCKKKFILNYFGESANLSCKLCNFCNPKILDINHNGLNKAAFSQKDLQLLNYHKEDELGVRINSTFAIMEAVNELDIGDIHIGKNTLAEFLKGSKSKRILRQELDKSKSYASLKHISIKEIISIADYLINEGYLTIIDADSEYPRPLIYLTENGENLLKEKKKISNLSQAS